VPGKGPLTAVRQLVANPATAMLPPPMLKMRLGQEPNIVAYFASGLVETFVEEINARGEQIRRDEIWQRLSGPYLTTDARFERIARMACGIQGLNPNHWWLPLVNMVGDQGLSYALAIIHAQVQQQESERRWGIAKTIAGIGLGGLLGWWLG